MTQFTTEMADVRGRKTVYARGGTGPTLVYLHSAMGETSVMGSPWLPFLDRLAERFDVVSTVHPGFGESGGLDEIDDVTDLVFHYLDLFDVLGIERAHLIGLSLGGWLAAEIAVFGPQVVDRLVLTDAVGLYVPGHEIAEIFGIPPAESARLMFHRPDRHPIGQLLLGMQGFRDTGLPQDLDPELLLPLIRAMGATAKLAWNPYMHDPKLARRLYRVQSPTLALWGAEDSLVPPFYAGEYARLIPDATALTIPDVGHMVPLEAEDVFVDAVTSFLTR